MVEILKVEALSSLSESPKEERLAAGYVPVTPMSPYGGMGYPAAYPVQPTIGYPGCAVTPVAAVAPVAVAPVAPVAAMPYPSTVVVNRDPTDDCCTGCLAAMCFCCLLDAMTHP
ncbi:hypothetical protein OESDEN_03854 [Oesophagostomum dentatum]|uniref:Cysteine-rich transmembrane domain-containing protein n=1 Tax=Oesophagostomum dentatum TaxID=61180 RepID=A0A0B1TF87_OESDE|nr:hypothetical protein OESDEN_03854 [Oesophagostomum dentatum]